MKDIIITKHYLERFFERILSKECTYNIKDVINKESEFEILKDRAIVVRKLKPLPIEAVIRGYLIGSGWVDYQKTGKICDIDLPHGLKQAEKLPEPIFIGSVRAKPSSSDRSYS